MVHNLPLLLTGAVHLLLAFYVLSNNPRNMVNISFFVLIILNVIYSLLLFLFMSFSYFYDKLSLLKLLFGIPALTPVAFYVFCRVFPQPDSIASFIRSMVPHALPAAFFFAISFTDLILKSTVMTRWGIRPVYGPLFPLYVLYFLVYLCAGLWTLLLKRSRMGGIERVQINYALLGTIVPFVLIVLVALVLPLMGIRQLSQSGPLFSIITVVAISYAIIRHRFMDVQIVLRSFLVHSLLGVALALVITGSFLMTRPLVLRHDVSSMIVAAVVVSAVISIMVQPLKGALERAVDRFVFKARRDYQRAVRIFSHDLANLQDLRTMKEFLVKRLVEIMHVKNGDLILFGDTNPGHGSCYGAHGEQIPAGQGRSREFLAAMLGRGEVLVKDELRRSLSPAEYKEVAQIFSSHDASVLVPLILQGRFAGLISLGEKKGGDIFSVEDINFLYTVGNQAAVAIQNALLYDEILEIKDYNENILEQMANGIITVDRAMCVTTFNGKATEITGVSKEEALGREAELVQPEIAQLLRDTMEEGRAFSNVELVVPREDGTQTPISVSTTALREPTGRMIGALAVFTDLTDIKVLEGEVRRAERLATIGTLAAGMAHEIKNPLVSLKTFSQLLPIKYDDPEFRDVFSKIASQEVDRINNIVEQLLRFARPAKPIFLPIDVHQPIEETLLLLANEISRRGVAVGKGFAGREILIFADNEQLKQVMVNVIFNALEATAGVDHPRVTIETTLGPRRARPWPSLRLPEGYAPTDQEVVVSIQDNGIGIAEEDLKHIFDPFFTTKEMGHGLGLSIAHSIIKEHMGTAMVHSWPGRGTTFSVAFPVIERRQGQWKDLQHEVLAHRLQ